MSEAEGRLRSERDTLVSMPTVCKNGPSSGRGRRRPCSHPRTSTFQFHSSSVKLMLIYFTARRIDISYDTIRTSKYSTVCFEFDFFSSGFSTLIALVLGSQVA